MMRAVMDSLITGMLGRQGGRGEMASVTGGQGFPARQSKHLARNLELVSRFRVRLSGSTPGPEWV